MIVINLFGGPGAGKSTTAAGLFFKMKNDKYVRSVELVTEFAKDMVYAGRTKELNSNQLYITAKQYSRMERLRGQVDFVIADSPIIQGSMYAPDNYFTFFTPLLRELHHSFDNFNIFINRVKKYKEYGRGQSEKESDELGCNIREFLDSNNLKYYVVDGNKSAPDTIKSLLLI